MRERLFRWIFADLPPFRWLNGHKTDIAKIFLYLFALIPAVQTVNTQFGIVMPMLEGINTHMGMLWSFLGLEVARQHRRDKGGDPE